MSEAQPGAPVLTALRAGDVVLLNTETLPGLHVLATVEGAAERLTATKGSAPGRPFLLLFDSAEHVFRYGEPVDPKDADALEDAWPGPLTALLPPTSRAPRPWVHDDRTIAARVPDSAALRELVRELGGPLFSTSANRAGEPPAVDLDEARRIFPDLPADPLDLRPLGLPSTVVDLSRSPGEILRPGASTWPPRKGPSGLP